MTTDCVSLTTALCFVLLCVLACVARSREKKVSDLGRKDVFFFVRFGLFWEKLGKKGFSFGGKRLFFFFFKKKKKKKRRNTYPWAVFFAFYPHLTLTLQHPLVCLNKGGSLLGKLHGKGLE